MNRKFYVVGVLLLALAAPGCRPKSKPTSEIKLNPASPVMTDMTRRMSELQMRSAEFSSVARQLPGADATSDRALVIDGFERATAALALLGGPSPGGAFRQQLRILDNVRSQLRNASTGLSTDSTTDTGLRAIYNALTNVRERLFPVNEKVREQLDALRDRVDELDTVRGPLHSTAVAHAFTAAADLIETMSSQLEGRATAAATQP